MCIMRSLFTCQRDIGINTPKNLTWPTCFAQKQKTERKTCTKSTFCCFPSSMNKSQSLFSLLKVWPGVPGELLGKWVDMQDRQQEKKVRIWESEKKPKMCWKSSPRRVAGQVNQNILVDDMIKKIVLLTNIIKTDDKERLRLSIKWKDPKTYRLNQLL